MKKRKRRFSERTEDIREDFAEFFFVVFFGLLALFAVTALCAGIIYMIKVWG